MTEGNQHAERANDRRVSGRIFKQIWVSDRLSGACASRKIFGFYTLHLDSDGASRSVHSYLLPAKVTLSMKPVLEFASRPPSVRSTVWVNTETVHSLASVRQPRKHRCPS
jgi:hypothetical protein